MPSNAHLPSATDWLHLLARLPIGTESHFMTYQYISIQTDDHVTTITLNRPEVHNALNAAAHRELDAAFDAFENDSDQWVAVITGAGDRAFCAGHDLKQQASGGGMETPASGFAGLTARYRMTKPVIAAVNGLAMGGGFEIVLACDIVVATESARFALPEPRIGLAALAGGLQRLPRMIGLNRAMGLLLTGWQFSAAEGLAMGLVNEVATESVLEASYRWAREIAECSPLSVRATKQAVLASFCSHLGDDCTAMWDLPAITEMLQSRDAVEGPLAFVERRKPRWTNS